MKKINILITLIALSFSVLGQGIQNHGAVIEVTSGAFITIVNGGYINKTQSATDGTIELDGTIALDGDFTNNADAGNIFVNTDGTGVVIFNGTTTQTIGGTGEYINFEGITVNSGASVEIPASKAATANGVLTVNGNFTLITPIGSSVSGSLITNSTIGGTGTITVQRYLTTSERFQHISIPMANITSDLLAVDPNPGYLNPNFYTMNEASDIDPDPSNSNYSNWSNYDDVWNRVQTDINTPVTLNSGTGYTFYHTQDINVSFATSSAVDLSSGDKVFAVTYTDNDDGNSNGNYYDGWNLLGNPFPSALDFNALTRPTHMDAALYLWNGTNYIYYGSGQISGSEQSLNEGTGEAGIIPAMQSFIVHMTKTEDGNLSEPLTIANSARTHSSQAMYKDKQNETPDFPFIKLQAVNNSNEKTDETIVRFIGEAAESFEGGTDMFKMFASGDVPQIYSFTSVPEFPLAINTLPNNNLNRTTPLGYYSSEAGSHTISATEMNFPSETNVYLLDTETNTEINLNEQPTYSFNHAGGDLRGRFYLFSGPGSPNSTNEINNSEISVWSANRNIFIRINTTSSDIDAIVKVYDLLGKPIKSQRMFTGLEEIHVASAEGIYIVNIQTKDGKVTTKKVVIRN